MSTSSISPPPLQTSSLHSSSDGVEIQIKCPKGSQIGIIPHNTSQGSQSRVQPLFTNEPDQPTLTPLVSYIFNKHRDNAFWCDYFFSQVPKGGVEPQAFAFAIPVDKLLEQAGASNLYFDTAKRSFCRAPKEQQQHLFSIAELRQCSQKAMSEEHQAAQEILLESLMEDKSSFAMLERRHQLLSLLDKISPLIDVVRHECATQKLLFVNLMVPPALAKKISDEQHDDCHFSEKVINAFFADGKLEEYPPALVKFTIGLCRNLPQNQFEESCKKAGEIFGCRSSQFTSTTLYGNSNHFNAQVNYRTQLECLDKLNKEIIVDTTPVTTHYVSKQESINRIHQCVMLTDNTVSVLSPGQINCEERSRDVIQTINTKNIRVVMSFQDLIASNTIVSAAFFESFSNTALFPGNRPWSNSHELIAELKQVNQLKMSYADIKALLLRSLTNSMLPGASLFEQGALRHCYRDIESRDWRPDDQQKCWLKDNPKAMVEAMLLRQLVHFESHILKENIKVHGQSDVNVWRLRLS